MHFNETIQEQQGRQEMRGASCLGLVRLSKLQMKVMMRRQSPRTEEPELERPSAQGESYEELPEPESAPEGRAQGQWELQRRCAELEQLLREHAVQLATAPAQQMQEETAGLLESAESLGCHVSSGQVRLCRCGNVLREDHQFCCKCGSQWAPGAPLRGGSVRLAGVVEDLDLRVQRADQALRDACKEAGMGGTDSAGAQRRMQTRET